MKQPLQSRASGRGPGATNTLLRWLCLPLAALCVALATPTGAAPYTFSGLSTTTPYGLNMHHWQEAANWSPLTGPPVGAPSHDVTFPTLPPSLLLGGLAKVVSDGPLVTLQDITFNATHVYLVTLSNCTPMQINGALRQNGPGDSFLHAQSGRLHLNNPVLAGSGVGLFTVLHPESVTGPVSVTGGNHEWQIAANAPCRPGGGPPALTLGALTFSGPSTFRLRSDVDVTFGGPVTLAGGATFCVMSLSGGATINVNATPFWIVAGGMLKYGAGVSGGSGSIIVSAGGMFAAGCSVATATVGGDLTFTSTGGTEFELGTPGVVGSGVNDLLNVQGVLTLGGTLVVAPQAGFGSGTYRLFNYSSTLVNNGMTITGLPAGLSGTLNTATPGQVNLIVAQSLDCCAGCAPPFPASLTVNVPPGYSYLVNPFCHGTANALGSIIANPPDGATLFKFNKATQAYSDPFTYDSGFGGWVDSNFDPASNTPLPPGEGFLFNNPGASAFSLTFTGCEPDCGPRCPPTNGLCLVGRTGSATNAVIWEHLFNCPPVCGSFVSIFNGASFDTYTFLGTGWSPAIPAWTAGTSVFVGRTNCDPCVSTNLLVNGSFEEGAFNHNGDDCQTLPNGSIIVTGWTVTLSDAARCQSGVLSGVTASHGTRLIDLTGYDNVVPHAGITQAVPTTIGQCYRLSFDLGVNPESPGLAGPITVRAMAGSSGWRTFTHNPSGSGTRWGNFGFSFTASSASTAITIEGLSANPYFIGLDNVVLTRSCDCTNNGCVIAINCPPDITASNTPGLCSAVVNYPSPTIIESCGANVVVTCTPPSGSSFAVGTNTVICTATNVAGQSVQCTFSVMVRDAEPPVMVCPQSITVTNCLLPQLVVSASDNCTTSNRLVFTQFPPGGTPVGAGTIIVVTRVCDSAGNCIDCDSLVTLVAPRDKYLTLNTGTDAADALLPGGSPEARWTNLFAPGGPTPMVVINPSSVPGAWVGGSTRSRWIGPSVSSAGPTGPYTNRWSFDAPCANVCLTGRFTSDDDGYLFVNGTLVAGPSGFSAWTSVNVCSGFVSGVNTLELVVNNRGGNTGFRTELEIWTECCNACVMTQACVAVPLNPSHWYTGGSGRDLVGRAPGTLEPGVTIVPGKIGNAMRFNGASGGMNLGNVPDLDFGANDSFTIEAWFNSRGPTALPNDGQIIVSLNYECSNEAQNLGIDWLSPTPFVYFFIRDEFGNNPGKLVSPPISPNVWHHVAAVRDRSVNPPQVRLYLDCELVDVKTDITTGSLARDCADLIGRRNTCTTENVFNGDIDEVTFYKRALTGLEIRRIAGAMKGKCRPDCAPLPPCAVALWKAENNQKESINNLQSKKFGGVTHLPGASGRAWSFDGVSGYVSTTMPSPLLNPSSGLSLCAWVSADGTPTVTAVIAGRPLGYQLDLLPSRQARFAITTAPGVFEHVDTPFPLSANRFTFVAGTYDPATGEMKLYVDCAPVASRILPVGGRNLYHRPNAPFQIGGFHDPTIPFTGGFLRGRVDDVALFSCALTPAEISARCNAGETGWCGRSKMFIEPASNGNLLLEWDNAAGLLQRASSPLGPWMAVPGVEGSLEVAPAGEAGYFRVQEFEQIDPQ